MTLPKYRNVLVAKVDFQNPEIFLECIFKQKSSCSKAN